MLKSSSQVKYEKKSETFRKGENKNIKMKIKNLDQFSKEQNVTKTVKTI